MTINSVCPVCLQSEHKKTNRNIQLSIQITYHFAHVFKIHLPGAC